MAEIRLSWADFRQAALNDLSRSHPQIALNKDDNARFTRVLSHEGECDCWELPEWVYIHLEN